SFQSPLVNSSYTMFLLQVLLYFTSTFFVPHLFNCELFFWKLTPQILILFYILQDYLALFNMNYNLIKSLFKTLVLGLILEVNFIEEAVKRYYIGWGFKFYFDNHMFFVLREWA
ncbi:hypothetical protein ACJX0J_029363, partial [Zea mays]